LSGTCTQFKTGEVIIFKTCTGADELETGMGEKDKVVSI
jgi:hypothetical protein